MLREIIEAVSLYLPSTDKQYTVYRDGTIRDNLSGLIVQSRYENGIEVVNIEHEGSTLVLKKALVVSIAFKNFRIPFKFWDRLDVEIVDLLKPPMDPSNLVITVPDGGIESDTYPGMYYVPGYTDYLVCKEGKRVIRLSTDRDVKIQVYGNYRSTSLMEGYHFFPVVNDVGNRSNFNLHRAIGLAVIKYPANVDKLDINHKDTNKSNNHYKNLEWRTRRGNNLHATESGLRSDNHVIFVKSIFTGEERTYFSMWECARWLGCHADYIKKCANNAGTNFYGPGILIRRKSELEQKPWPTKEQLDSLARNHAPDLVGVYYVLDTVSRERLKIAFQLYGVREFFKKSESVKEVNCVVQKYTLSMEEVCRSFFVEKQKSHIT